MSEMKNGSTDPKVIARTIIVNHGTNVSMDNVDKIAFEAVGAEDWPAHGRRFVTEIWDLIQDADVTVTWTDDEPSSSAACDDPCCGGHFTDHYVDADRYND